MKKKYWPGITIGPDNILFVEEIDSNTKHRKGIFKCPYDNILFEAYIDNIASGKTRSCGCLRKQTATQHCLDMAKVRKNLQGQRFGNCKVIQEAPEQKRDNHIYWKCLCDCGEIFYARTDNLKSFITTCCPICSKSMSHGERLIKTILKQHQIQYRREVCKIINRVAYRFDFYLLDYNCYIEFDGEQHYKSHFYDRFKNEDSKQLLLECQQRDKIKNQYCLDNNILLIRIPYTKISTLQLEDLLPSTSNFVIER